MNNNSVAILDTTGRSRVKALGSAFEHDAKITNFESYNSQRGWLDNSGGNLSAHSIILWHGGDFEGKQRGVKGKGKVIFYGGYGEFDNRIPFNDDRICSIIEKKADVERVFTSKAVKEILTYARERGSKPMCIHRNQRIVAKALLHLCQGYLAAWAVDQEEIDSKNDSIKKQYAALQSMGWFDLNESNLTHSLHGRLHTDRNKGGVQAAAWWQCAISDLELDESIHSELGDTAMKETGSESIKELSSEIKGNYKIRAETVAHAYNFLAERV